MSIPCTLSNGKTFNATTEFYATDAYNAGKAAGSSTLTIGGVAVGAGTYTLQKAGDSASYVGRVPANYELWLKDSDGNLAGRFMSSASYNRYMYRATVQKTFKQVEDVEIVYSVG